MLEITSESNNEENNRIISSPIKIKLEKFGAINKCYLLGPVVIGSYSMLSHSTVGRYLGIGSFSYVRSVECGNYVSIGSRVSIGGFNHPTSWLSTHQFQYEDTYDNFNERIDPKKLSPSRKNNGTRVQLGNDVWVGDNVCILEGVKIADGCVIGAGSVVINSITAPYSIAVGNPARIIKRRFNNETIKRLMKSLWWNLKISEMPDEMNFEDISNCLDILESQKEL